MVLVVSVAGVDAVVWEDAVLSVIFVVCVGDVVCASSETDAVVCCVSSGAGAFLSSRRKKTNNTQAAATNIRTINTAAADKISCRCFLFFRAVARRFWRIASALDGRRGSC